MTDGLFAYLDPGTGATLVQLALAGTAGIAAAAKLRMNRLKRHISSESESHEDEAAEHPTEDLAERSAPGD